MDKAMKDALIERAARAAMDRCDAALRWDSIGEPERQGWKRQAEAALEATGVFDLVEAAMRWKEARETPYEVKPPEALHSAEYNAAADMSAALNRMMEQHNG